MNLSLKVKHGNSVIIMAFGVRGVINHLEGYGNDNPGANVHVR